MRSLLVVAAAVAVIAVAIGAHPAFAHKRFAKKEGRECKESHENPEGGGPRNIIAQYYQAKHELPLDRSDDGMKLVRDTVDRWMQSVLAVSPVIRWSHKPLDALPEATPPSYTAASDAAVLRRLSLDLRQTVPSAEE